MSNYYHRKVIRMQISVEEACRIFNAEGVWDIESCLAGTNFEIAPTTNFFLDYVLSSKDDVEGDWGRARQLGFAEYAKYRSKFSKLLNGREVKPDELRLVEYCWYTCSEARDYFDDSVYHDDFYDEV